MTKQHVRRNTGVGEPGGGSGIEEGTTAAAAAAKGAGRTGVTAIKTKTTSFEESTTIDTSSSTRRGDTAGSGLALGGPPSATPTTTRSSPPVRSLSRSKSSSGGSSQRLTIKSYRIIQAVWASKLIFVSFLALVATLTSYLLYSYLHGNEIQLAQDQFTYISDRALNSATDIVKRKRLSLITMSTIITEQIRHSESTSFVSAHHNNDAISASSNNHNDGYNWPFEHVHGFDPIVHQLSKTASLPAMGFAPFVTVEQQDEWERYVYDYFDSLTPSYYPNGTAINPEFGKGIWKFAGPNIRVHDNNKTEIKERGGFVTPVFQCCIDNPGDRVLLFNLHSEMNRRQTINNLINCTNNNRNRRRGEEEETTATATAVATVDNAGDDCGTTTDLLRIVRFEHRGPASVMFQPIYFPTTRTRTTATTTTEDNDDTSQQQMPLQQLLPAGLVLAPIVWDEMFDNAFHMDMNGIHCVLESETQIHTYTITNGIVESFAQGDLHQDKYTHLGQTRNLTSTKLHEQGAPMYKLSLYPSDDFYKLYNTKNPRNATIVAVIVIVVTSLLFLLYDSFVRREFKERKNLLEAKRRFMRYVSHEVRTPLNAVVMGLTVVQSELHAIFDDNCIKKDNNNNRQSRADSAVCSAGVGRCCEKSENEDGKEEEASLLVKGQECLNLLDDIHGSAQSAVDVLNDVLQYDKIEHSSLRLEITMLPIWSLVDKTISEFKLSAARESVNLKIMYRGDSLLSARTAAVSDLEQQQINPESWISNVEDLPFHIQNLKVAGDSARIAQVVRNLLSNALKFTPMNGTVLVQTDFYQEGNLQDRDNSSQHFDLPLVQQEKIKLKDGQEILAEKKGVLRIRVTDTGVGMTDDQIANVFGEGVQFNVNELQAGKGSGLGLYITKGIVRQHRGTLLAESDGPGYGCVFTATFPAYHVPDVSSNNRLDQHPSSSYQEQQHGQSSKSNDSQVTTEGDDGIQQGDDYAASSSSEQLLKLLVVDDVLSNRKLVSRLLTNKGHECDQAENGAVAVNMVRNSMLFEESNGDVQQESSPKRPYDCVLLDFEMPVMNGPTAAAKIRALGSDVFIVGITGNVLDEDVDYFKSRGANAVIPKPLQVSALEDLWMEYSVK